MFRIGGNIKLENTEDLYKTQQESKLRLRIGKNNKSLSFIQYLQPLSAKNPYFYVHILNIKSEGIITAGIASLDIEEDHNPGYWNNTIGYESQTGKCISSHRVNANTLGRPVLKNDTFGLFVSNFGSYQSTVLFIHNNEPVASRYHFENDHNKYLPTITFENGPIDVDIYWQDIVDPYLALPFYKENKFIWIKPSDETCVSTNETEYENVLKLEDVSIQSSEPLSKSYPHYKCIQLDVSETGQGSSVGIASCSPLKPTPTCSLLRDYYTWLPKMKLKYGQSIGWGIFYNPNTPHVNDKYEQLALVYVTFNDNIVDVLFVLQPEGGFFPLVLMQPWATKVKLELTQTINQDEWNKLTKLFNVKLQPALEIYNKDINESIVYGSDITFLSDNVNIVIENFKTILKIPPGNHGVHFIQYKRKLTTERRFFFIEINKLGLNSNVIIGVGASFSSTNENFSLGQQKDTIGFYSKTGQMFYNGKCTGNMMGQKCLRGDSMGLEIANFDKKMSVALFTKNFKPIGTRFLTLEDLDSFFPSIQIESTGEEIEITVYWQTVVSMPPHYNIRNPEDWCMPEHTKVDVKEKNFILPDHLDHSLCLQAPYSLHSKYNHFEIILIDEFDKNNPPPAIALCTACPLDPAPLSQFKQDYLRFWPVGEAMSAVKKNDRLGWGIYNAGKLENKDKEQLMICFLTINRQVVYIRVLFQPPGGFYPVIIVPPNVFRIKMDSMANRVNTEDFGNEQIKSILLDTYKQIESEKSLIAQGKNPRDEIDDSKRSKMCNIL